MGALWRRRRFAARARIHLAALTLAAASAGGHGGAWCGLERVEI